MRTNSACSTGTFTALEVRERPGSSTLPPKIQVEKAEAWRHLTA
jgi:hypothetical protein